MGAPRAGREVETGAAERRCCLVFVGLVAGHCPRRVAPSGYEARTRARDCQHRRWARQNCIIRQLIIESVLLVIAAAFWVLLRG